MLDGKVQPDYKVTKPEDQHSAVNIFKQMLELRLGCAINFIPTRTDEEAIATVVFLLIEIDNTVTTIQHWAHGQETISVLDLVRSTPLSNNF